MNCFYIITLITCLCLGIRTITDTDKLLEPLKDMLGIYLPVWLWKVVVGCVTCMTSFWGTVVFWTLQLSGPGIITSVTLLKWAFCCVAASFFNELGWSIIVLIRERISVFMKQQGS